ncbi:MAG: hypothetical protein EBU34_11715 [Alphaproteobacteria bacterium]|nr:hypothetical protein [Alphaproteobacteria bacterium]
MVADEPSDHAEFMRAFTGIDEFSATSAGLRFETPRGEIDVLSDAAFNFDYGQMMSGNKPRLAAFTVAVPDFDGLKGRLNGERIAFQSYKDSVVISAPDAFGVIIRFVKR